MKTATRTARHLVFFGKWLLIALLCGLAIGAVGVAFSYSMSYATDLRGRYGFIVFLLPLGGLAIVWLYRALGDPDDRGTNLVIQSIQSKEQIPLRVTPLIFISTVLTHLLGGSAGREGAALQLGGSLANRLGKWLRLGENERHIIVMCGMSAAFSALFGTPLAAAVFAIEMVNVGAMQSAALFPCCVASLAANALAVALGLRPEAFPLIDLPALSFASGGSALLVCMAATAVGVLFCATLHFAHRGLKRLFPNPYPRAAVVGAAIALCALLPGMRAYLGAGMNVIAAALSGNARPEAFLLKAIFTALTLGAGYKGGEIVPAFFVGATFGCVFGQLLGFAPALCAAMGMLAVFCGVTNCPVASILIGLELFGMAGAPFYLLAVAVSYLLSGNCGLYDSQHIAVNRYTGERVDMTVRDRES